MSDRAIWGELNADWGAAGRLAAGTAVAGALKRLMRFDWSLGRSDRDRFEPSPLVTKTLSANSGVKRT